MDSTDAHLEASLEELNDKVFRLEEDGSAEDLMEAYVNRGCVLQMLEFRTSALDDLFSAREIMEELEDSGTEVDSGTYVRIHTSIASILFDQGGECVEEYVLAAGRLSSLTPESRHFDSRSIIRTCIDSIKNLIDSEFPEEIVPYYEKAYSLTVGKSDPWNLNRRFDIETLAAEAFSDRGMPQESIESYSSAIELALELMETGRLEDVESLLTAYVMRGEQEASVGLPDAYIADLTAAATLADTMFENGRMSYPEVIQSIHHNLAEALMKNGRIQEAEKHLIKAMQVGVLGAGDYIRNNRP